MSLTTALGRTAGSSFTRAVTSDPKQALLVLEGNALASDISNTTTARRLIQSRREKKALTDPNVYMDEKIRMMEQIDNFLRVSITNFYDSILLDDAGQLKMTPYEAKKLTKEFGEDMAIALDKAFMKMYPDGQNDAVEELVKEKAIAGTVAGLKRSARIKKV